MLTIERAVPDRTTLTNLFGRLLIAMHGEIGIAPLDVETAMAAAFVAISEGHSFMAMEDGELVGSIAMTTRPIWYSRDHTMLMDAWFYVMPDKRFGLVGGRLLRAARDEGKALGLPTFVVIANPHRPHPKTERSLYAVIAGFIPGAHVLRIA